MFSKLGRVLKWGLAALVFGTAVGTAWLFTSLPVSEGKVVLDGPKDRIEIYRDGSGIPNIFARSDEDAYFALGYVHAQDRLWQMDSMRRMALGKLAEILGSRALASDKFMRTLGFGQLVEEQFSILDEPVRQALTSYAAGVNAWLEQRPFGSVRALPPEFIMLGFRPDPWRPADSLLWGKIMALQLSGNWQDEILRARMLKRLTPEQVSRLWPPFPDDRKPPPDIKGNDTSWWNETTDSVLEALADGPLGLMRAPRGASNAWVTGGAKNAGGKPILANDPHLGFAAPILWYLARIETPDLKITGATVPGVPFTILGHNADIAWGITSTESDLQDLFMEQAVPGDPRRYLSPDGFKDFVVRKEIIKVRNDPDVTISVRESDHGPIISDVLRAAPVRGGSALALSATYLKSGDKTPQALFRLNRARNWDAFTRAMADFNAPQENVVYADREGNIGFMAPGRVPIRRNGKGRYPKEGWTGEQDWLGYIPFKELPRAFNPKSGQFVAANNKIIPDDYPYFITEDWAPSYRAKRIASLLSELAPLTLERTMEYQMDSVSLMARELLPLMLAVKPVTKRQRRVHAWLGEWKGDMARRKSEPLIFSAWLRELSRAIYADELGPLFERYWSLSPRFIATVLKGDREWCDDVKTPDKESCGGRVLLALDRALDSLEAQFGKDIRKWEWGAVHKARFVHPLFGDILDGVPILGKLVNLEAEVDGGGYTVNRGASRVSNSKAPFQSIHGPGLRAVYDLGDLAKSRFVIATGQSGNPLSSHYKDQLALWRDGMTLKLEWDRLDFEKEGLKPLILLPPINISNK